MNGLVALLQEQAPQAIQAGDRRHGSAQPLQELRGAPLSGPLIPLADGALLVNAPSEPSVGLALQAEIPSADRIDRLCAFIKWSGLRLLEPVLSAYLQAGGELRVVSTVYLGASDRRAPDWLGSHLQIQSCPIGHHCGQALQ